MRFSLCIGLVASAAGLAHATKLKLDAFTSLVLFGDSYTDQGVRQYRPGADGTIPAPSNSTASGGRQWPQYVRQYAGVNIYDYAIGGAVCDSTTVPSVRTGINQTQIPTFLEDHRWRSPTTGRPALRNPPKETVYAVWIGTNDLGNAGWLTESQLPRGRPLTYETDCVYSQIDTLYRTVGARNFVIMNLAPLDLLPQYALPENGGVEVSRFWADKLAYNANITQTSEKMRQYRTMVNAVYDLQTPHLVKLTNRYPNSAFAVFDVYSLFLDIWNNPSAYLNGTAPPNATGFVTACAQTSCPDKSDWDSFLWYDELHPSEQAGRIVAKEFIKVVKGGSKYVKYWKN